MYMRDKCTCVCFDKNVYRVIDRIDWFASQPDPCEQKERREKKDFF